MEAWKRFAVSDSESDSEDRSESKTSVRIDRPSLKDDSTTFSGSHRHDKEDIPDEFLKFFNDELLKDREEMLATHLQRFQAPGGRESPPSLSVSSLGSDDMEEDPSVVLRNTAMSEPKVNADNSESDDDSGVPSIQTQLSSHHQLQQAHLPAVVNSPNQSQQLQQQAFLPPVVVTVLHNDQGQQQACLAPVGASRPNCNCEGCIRSYSGKPCGMCSPCINGGLCHFFCCINASFPSLQKAYCELQRIRTAHIPKYKVEDTIWISSSNKKRWFKWRIHSFQRPNKFRVKNESGQLKTVSVSQMSDELMVQVVKHIECLDRAILKHKATATLEAEQMLKPRGKHSPNASLKEPKKRQKRNTPTKSETRLNTTIKVGDRVLALYETHLYWGKVTRINVDVEGEQLFWVWFDDDDYRINVKETELLSEAEVQQSFPERLQDKRRVDWKLPEIMSLQAINAKSCKRCPQCQVQACGNCTSCQWNNDHPISSRDEKACLLKFCPQLKIPKKAERAQRLPDSFPEEWRFYFTRSTSETTATCAYDITFCFCGKYEELGLVIKIGEKRETCLMEALNAAGFDETRAHTALHEFYAMIGVLFDRSCANHFLLGKMWSRTWLDQACTKQQVFGRINCCEKVVDFSLLKGFRYVFTVHCDTTQPIEISPSIVINEEDAWGGLVLEQCEKADCVIPPEVSLTWNTPTDVDNDYHFGSYPAMYFSFREHRFGFIVDRSLIPKAGLGLFLTCHALAKSPTPGHLELKPGEFLDLGVYAPQREEDEVSLLCYNIKSFLFNGKPQVWAVDSINGTVFDPTDGLTGELNETTRKQSPIVFANETDGKESTSLMLACDPVGAYHYLLGSWDGLSIPVGSGKMELKTDHGLKFEPSRVRNAYPRVTGWQLRGYQKMIAKEDFLFLNKDFEGEHEQTLEAVEYILKFVPHLNDGRIDRKIYPRLLLLAKVLWANLEDIPKQEELREEVNNLIRRLWERLSKAPSEFKEFKELAEKTGQLYRFRNIDEIFFFRHQMP